ncbi:hypothetical protein OG689_10920 [Kitasatospora sp. NBC_00240]|uniref:hypothetical protein n=1 Tax=Kitasatospora sp. NBC_00240 TaxID=2903567 RepID=UPI00225505FD|nr:hypothetical protein [Kitasatospora sp. NBC_00240]MCX5209796.1 hypothetical protein [Kitasatospora sp. NBC_00240]
MNRRPAGPAEHQTLSTIAIAVALLAWTWTPGPLAAPAAILTQLLVVTAGAWALRWNIPSALTANQQHLRLTAAATLALTAALLHYTANTIAPNHQPATH